MSETPPGFMKDAQGRLVPIANIKEIDRERDALVREIVAKAHQVSGVLAQFKADAMGDIGAFVELSAEKYGVSLGGIKGNIQLTTFDGEYKIRRDITEHQAFDERLQAAKALIDECILRWSEGGNTNLRALVTDAFNVDKEGKINVNRILALRRIGIDDEQWQTAMKAIGDSLTVEGSKAYLRLYRRQSDGSYRQIDLDLASL